MNDKSLCRSRIRKQSGAALLESALCFPLLIMIVMGVIDTGRWLNTHFIASRIAYETSRYAASVPELEKSEVTTSFDLYGIPQSAFQANQGKVLVRAGRVIRQYNTLNPVAKNVEIRLKYKDDCTNGSASVDNKAISVSVKIPFEPFFPFIKLSSVSASAHSAYLYTEQNCVVG